MKKFNAFLTIVIALLSVASLIVKFFIDVNFENFDFQTAEAIIVILCISLAILFALIERNYLAALVISLIKIVVTFANGLLVNLTSIIESGNFVFNLSEYLAIANTVILLLSIFTMFSLIKQRQFHVDKPKFKLFIWPFIVMMFYSIYRSSDTGFIIGLTELIALILAAHVSESILFIGAMVFIPLDFTKMILDKAVFTTANIVELAVGGAIFIVAIVTFIYSLVNCLKDKESNLGRIVE